MCYPGFSVVLLSSLFRKMFLYLTILVVAFLCYKVYKKHIYWRERGVEQESVGTILYSFLEMFQGKYTILDNIQKLYDKFPGSSVYGAYSLGSPMMIVKDPEMIKQITIKDFDYFMDHADFFAGDKYEELWSKNLFSLKGDRWRFMRATLSPSFTTSKIKGMFHLMSDCAAQFTNYFLEKNDDVTVVELKDIFSRYANDVIATCSFGIEVDSLKDSSNQFYLSGKTITDFAGLGSLIRSVMLVLMPRFSKLLGITFMNKDAAQYFTKVVTENVKAREEKGIVRPDMIHLLMEARKGTLKHEDVPETTNELGFAAVQESEVGRTQQGAQDISLIDMVALALNFFFAGFETVSTVLRFTAHELAVNPEVQKKLVDEVDATRRGCGGKLSYEDIKKMKYLDMVISESLRKWPPAVAGDRVCVKDYNLKTEKGHILVPKGTQLLFPTSALHLNPKYFPDPQRFDPDRFDDQNRSSIDSSFYHPFGTGPRSCIASRFALLEIKVLFYHLLSAFELTVVEKTQVPVQLSKTAFALQVDEGMWLGLKKRK